MEHKRAYPPRCPIREAMFPKLKGLTNSKGLIRLLADSRFVSGYNRHSADVRWGISIQHPQMTGHFMPGQSVFNHNCTLLTTL